MAVTRAAIYVRVSTTNQEEEGSSLPSQERLCRAYATDHGWEVVRVCQDAYTGSLWRERPGLSEVRELVKVAAVDVVLCYALDRLSRNQTHVAAFMDEIEHFGARLEIVTEDFENSATGKFIRSARAFAAELEREKIIERQVRGKRERALSGKLHRSGVDPYGYTRVTIANSDIVREIVETEAAVVRQMYNWMADGHSLRSITSQLNAQGVPSPAVVREINRDGNPIWGKSQVRRILTNPMYKGETYAWRHKSGGKGSGVNRPPEEWILLPQGLTPAIVTHSLWDRVQERLASNTGAITRNTKSPYLLRGIIYCSNCGARMWTDTEHGIRTYRCSSRQLRGGACGGSRVRAEAIEEDIWERAATILSNPATIAAEIEPQRKPATQSTELSRRRALERSLQRLDLRTAKLTRQFQRTDDESAWDVIMADLKRVDEERASIFLTLAELESVLASEEITKIDLATLEDYAKRVSTNLSGLTFDEKRFVLEQALKASVWANGKEWTVEWGL